MGLFSKRKSRAERRAEAKALKAKAKLEARLTARNAARIERRRIKSSERIHDKELRAQSKTQRETDRTALKVAQAELKAKKEGRLLSPTRIRRTLTVTRLLAPVLVPIIYRAATAARGLLDERRAERLGVPLSQLGQFSGQGGALSARIAGAERSVVAVAGNHPKDGETQKFVKAMTAQLTDLAAAITAAENMPPAQRRAAHTAISDQLDGVDADLMARLGVR